MKEAQAFSAEERREYIGGSEVGAILGIDQYRSPLDVYNLKMGLVKPFEGNQHTERGNRLEAIAAEFYTEKTGEKLRRRRQEYQHAELDYFRGHIDRLVEGQDRIAEIKCPSVAAFRKYQREGLPESMVLQLQSYMGLSKKQAGTWIIFCADQFDAASWTIEFDPDLYEGIVEGVQLFWEENILKEKPPKSERRDAEWLKISKPSGSVSMMDDSPEFLAAVRDLREAYQIQADAKELMAAAKAEALAVIDSKPGIYEGGGCRLHYQMQAGRRTFQPKELAAAHPDLDLEPFYKQGAPFPNFRPYFFPEAE